MPAASGATASDLARAEVRQARPLGRERPVVHAPHGVEVVRGGEHDAERRAAPSTSRTAPNALEHRQQLAREAGQARQAEARERGERERAAPPRQRAPQPAEARDLARVRAVVQQPDEQEQQRRRRARGSPCRASRRRCAAGVPTAIASTTKPMCETDEYATRRLRSVCASAMSAPYTMPMMPSAGEQRRRGRRTPRARAAARGAAARSRPSSAARRRA